MNLGTLEAITAALFILILIACNAAVDWSQLQYQTPKINFQQQSKQRVGGQEGSANAPSQLENLAGNVQNEHRSDTAAEIAILGVKLGDWLLFSVTLLLW